MKLDSQHSGTRISNDDADGTETRTGGPYVLFTSYTSLFRVPTTRARRNDLLNILSHQLALSDEIRRICAVSTENWVCVEISLACQAQLRPTPRDTEERPMEFIEDLRAAFVICIQLKIASGRLQPVSLPEKRHRDSFM